MAISQNTALFSILGTTYGGDGRTTFGLPDLRGNTPVAAINNSHFYLGGGVHIGLTDDLILTPRFMMRTVEGAPTSYDAGASLNIQDNKYTVGVNARLEETTSLYGLIRVIEKLRLGFAYDISTADATIINDNGSLEFILKYQF